MKEKQVQIKQWQSLIHSLHSLVAENNIDKHHVEDIAIRNKKIFPDFFGWSKYKEYIDLRQVMRTMDKLKEEGVVIGSNTSMWCLTKKGFDFGKQLNNHNLIGTKKLRQNSDYHSFEIKRILTSESYKKYVQNKIELIENNEIKYLFRIDSYNLSKDSVTRNKERLYIASSSNDELKQFIDLMWELVFEREILNKNDYK